MNHKLLKLGIALKNIQDQPWKCDLYIQGKYPWNINSICAILQSEDEDYEPNQADLEYAENNHLHRNLSIHELQQIESNAKQQKDDILELDLVEAFNFYNKNDAFIQFE